MYIVVYLNILQRRHQRSPAVQKRSLALCYYLYYLYSHTLAQITITFVQLANIILRHSEKPLQGGKLLLLAAPVI